MNGPSPQHRCVGCGLVADPVAGPTHRYMTSSPACWAMYGQLTARLLGTPSLAGGRQYCVDAYAVQHPGTTSPQAIQSLAVHLMSLYAHFELGGAIQAAPTLLQRAAQIKGRYRWLEPPPSPDWITVQNVLQSPDAQLASTARVWAVQAWQAWGSHHALVAEWYRRYLVGPA